ncbi:hypothetical protein ACA910_014168 [Epithemia clementina (nom. ined.)]
MAFLNPTEKLAANEANIAALQAELGQAINQLRLVTADLGAVQDWARTEPNLVATAPKTSATLPMTRRLEKLESLFGSAYETCASPNMLQRLLWLEKFGLKGKGMGPLDRVSQLEQFLLRGCMSRVQ